MVVQNYLENFNWGYPIFISVWIRSCVPVEISVPNTRYQFSAKEQNNEKLHFELDTSDEKCEVAAVQIAHYK